MPRWTLSAPSKSLCFSWSLPNKRFQTFIAFLKLPLLPLPNSHAFADHRPSISQERTKITLEHSESPCLVCSSVCLSAHRPCSCRGEGVLLGYAPGSSPSSSQSLALWLPLSVLYLSLLSLGFLPLLNKSLSPAGVLPFSPASYQVCQKNCVRLRFPFPYPLVTRPVAF